MAKTDTAGATKASTTGLPPTPGKLPGAPPRYRRKKAGPDDKRKKRTLTREQASAMGKLGGRPPGSITKAYATIYELAKRVMTDPIVQDRILWDAQMGTLNPSTMRDLMYTFGGRPAYKMQVQRTVTTDADEEREKAALRDMDPDRRRLLGDLIRETQAAMLALPQARIVPESTDAEITTPE